MAVAYLVGTVGLLLAAVGLGAILAEVVWRHSDQQPPAGGDRS